VISLAIFLLCLISPVLILAGVLLFAMLDRSQREERAMRLKERVLETLANIKGDETVLVSDLVGNLPPEILGAAISHWCYSGTGDDLALKMARAIGQVWPYWDTSARQVFIHALNGVATYRDSADLYEKVMACIMGDKPVS